MPSHLRSVRVILAARLLLMLLTLLAITRPAPALALDPGTEAIVSADGDCLNLRILPGLSSTVLTCIPDGSTVSVPGGEATVDGIQWQRLNFAGRSGWSNAQYLRAVAVTPPPQPEGSLIGSLPASGVGLAVWSGGPVDRIASIAALRGCTLRAVWTSPSGTFISYVFGAPSVVNVQWLAAYPGNTLAANSPLIVVCGAPAVGQPAPTTPTPPTTPVATPPPGPGQVASIPPGMPSTPAGPAGNR